MTPDGHHNTATDRSKPAPGRALSLVSASGNRVGLAANPDRKQTAEEPVRLCIGCRTRDAKTQLLRIVSVGNRVSVDERRRLPGRGAYIHPSIACVQQANRKKALSRALRVALDPEQTSALWRQVTKSLAGGTGVGADHRDTGTTQIRYIANPSSRTTPENGVMNRLTRPHRQVVDETRQAKGQ